MAKDKSLVSQLNSSNNNEPVDIDLSLTAKKRFRINIDDNPNRDNNILELNTSDLGIVNRMSEAYAQLKDFQAESTKLMEEISNMEETDDDAEVGEQLQLASKNLATIDKKMRSLIDFIFDSNVSEICAPFGSMYDPLYGSFRYEHILNKLTNLYEDALRIEMGRIRQNVANATKKYTKKK